MLATDGVWEVMDCDEVARFVGAWRERPWPGWSASDALSLEAQERWKLLQPEVGCPVVILTVSLVSVSPQQSSSGGCRLLHGPVVLLRWCFAGQDQLHSDGSGPGPHCSGCGAHVVALPVRLIRHACARR